MTAHRGRRVCGAALLILAACGPGAAGTSEEALAAMCAACHRLDGGAPAGRAITGRAPEALERSMRAFRANERPNHIMHTVALSLSEEEIMSLARHLATLGKKAARP